MKKRNLVCLLLCAVLLVAALPTAASAATLPSGIPGWSNGIDFAKELTLRAMVLAANLRISALVKIAQATPYDDVDWLLREVDNTTRPVFAFANAIGATVICEYDEYWIDGRIVLVDPLKVINL